MRETLNNLKVVFKYGKEFRINLLFEVICSLFRVIVGIILPLFAAKQIVYFTDNLWQQAILISIVICIVNILQSLNNVIFRKNTQVFRRGTVKNIQLELGKEILKIEQKYLDNNSSGVFIQRIVNDTDNMSLIFTSGMSNLTVVVSSLGAFIAIFFIDKMVFLYYLVTSMVLVILYLLKMKKYSIKDKEYRDSVEEVASITGELIRGTKDIKTLDSKDSFINVLEYKVNKQIKKNFEMRNVEISYNFFTDLLKSIFELLLIFLLIYLTNINKIEISLAIALFSYKNNIFSNFMDRLSTLFNEINNFNISSKRVLNILGNHEFKKESFGKYHLDKVNGNIRFENVSFKYEEEKEVLNNLSFSVKAGQKVAFVGKSGEGKTTIFNLLCKLYTINSGKILIENVDINELDESSIRGNISVINQNPYIFNLSIKDNFRLVKSNITDEEIKEVCNACSIAEFIETLPNKYDTILGENGVLLSGGQKQRIAIARALLQKTPIILFDEATSALDNETQENINISTKTLKGKRTICIIAHRLSTIVDCDNIFVINKGKIVDSGSHEYLIKNSEIYKKLCKKELITET